jgi:hypothetical protein
VAYYRRNRTKELGRVRSRQAATRDFLRRRRKQPCADCGRTYLPHQMDFDHRDPSQKTSTVSRMIGRAGTGRIMAEVAKCDIVCANCHRDRTYRRREAGSSERE